MEKKRVRWPAKDKTQIEAKIYSAADKLKGIIIICHGFGEHKGSYREFAESLQRRGYTCIVFDQRGHGCQCRPKDHGIIAKYDCFLDDLDVIRKEAVSLFPGIPLYLYGHSMGGNIALSYLLQRGQQNFAAAVLETPWLRLAKPVRAPVVALAEILGKINPHWAIVSKINSDHLSRDKKRNTEISADGLYHNRISFRMFSGIRTAGEYALSHGNQISIPVFLVCAGGDRIVSSDAIKKFAAQAKENVVLKIYEQAYHSVHNDLIKESYVNDLVEFLNAV